MVSVVNEVRCFRRLLPFPGKCKKTEVSEHAAIPVYVPAEGALSHVPAGSGLCGVLTTLTFDGTTQVLRLYAAPRAAAAEAEETFADRMFRAWRAMVDRDPGRQTTIAHQDAVVEVGSFYPSMGKVVVEKCKLLCAWLGLGKKRRRLLPQLTLSSNIS